VCYASRDNRVGGGGGGGGGVVITSAEQERSVSATASLVCGGCLQLVHSSAAGGRNVSISVEDHNLRSDYVCCVTAGNFSLRAGSFSFPRCRSWYVTGGPEEVGSLSESAHDPEIQLL
jgi:hypothetical protein